MATLAIDVGTTIVGVITDQGKYSPYYEDRRAVAIRRIQTANVLVTFLGTNYHDLIELGILAGLKGPLPLQGTLIDMRAICYTNGYCGLTLLSIYKKRFGTLPDLPDTYEGNNHRDCLMPLELYKAWKKGTLSPA